MERTRLFKGTLISIEHAGKTSLIYEPALPAEITVDHAYWPAASPHG